MVFQQSRQKLCTSLTIAPQLAQRGGKAKSSAQRPAERSNTRTMAPCRLAEPSAQAPRGGPVRHEGASAKARPRGSVEARAVPLRTGVRRLPAAAFAHATD